MDGMIPRSRSGWWTGWLVAAFAGCYLIGGLTAVLVQNSASSVGQPVETAVAMAGLACVVGAVVTGVAALRKKDRSAPVLVALGLGVIAVVFLIGELAISR